MRSSSISLVKEEDFKKIVEPCEVGLETRGLINDYVL